MSKGLMKVPISNDNWFLVGRNSMVMLRPCDKGNPLPQGINFTVDRGKIEGTYPMNKRAMEKGEL